MVMKFSEIPQKAMEAAGKFTQEQLDNRRKRLSDPTLQASLERTKDLIKDDIKNVCGNGLSAMWRFSLGAPLSSMWEGTKEFGSVVSHNFSTKNPKKKRSYTEVPAAMVAELFTQYGKGAIDVTKLVGNLSIALGRTTVLGGRYIVGK